MAIKPTEALLRLAAEIRDELQKLDWLYAEWQGVDVDAGAHSLLMRGKTSVFHDFYCGAERIFKKCPRSERLKKIPPPISSLNTRSKRF